MELQGKPIPTIKAEGSRIVVSYEVGVAKVGAKTSDSATMAMETEKELDVLRKRIADNPGTLAALQAEIFLLDYKVARAQTTATGRQILWSTMEPLAAQYADLLQKYPADVLKQQDQGASIKLRQASLYLYLTNDHNAY